MGQRIQNVHPKTFNGVTYRSTLEAQTAEALFQLGIPFEYESLKLTLLDHFRSPFCKTMVRAVTYTPDFKIGNIIIECKGFETPEWKLKKKFVLKYIDANMPDVYYYQTRNAGTDLLRVLDKHWDDIGYCILVDSQKKYSSVFEAMKDLGLGHKSPSSVFSCLKKTKDKAYKHTWKIIKKDE